MWRKVRHLSDAELLILTEERAQWGRRSKARAHLAECPGCRQRQAALGVAARAAGRACRERPVALAPLRVARNRLIAAMEIRGARIRARAWAVRMAGAVAVVVAAVLLWSAVDRSLPAPGAGKDGVRIASGLLLPRPELTPGSVRPVRLDAVCGRGVAGAPVVAAQVPRQVFAAYGVDYRRAADYELDFLITPELGGASDVDNLWPQPYRHVVWNAYVKDELERHLRRLVCRGALDLETAQRELAGDWIAAYKRRFDTRRPLRDYDRFPLTANDVEALQAEANERRLLREARRS